MRYRLLIVIVYLIESLLYAKAQNDSIFNFNTVDNLYHSLNRDIEVVHTPRPEYVKDIDTPTMSLNGDWSFAANIEAVEDVVSLSDFNWQPITVPSEWYMEAFQIEWYKWGAYYKEFQIPSDWKNHKTLIRFGAVESECRIYLNGKYVGSHIGSMTQFEKDLTPYLRSSTNHLLVYVRRESLASDISKISHYAKHQVGGLLRGVELIAVPKTHITDLYCEAIIY